MSAPTTTPPPTTPPSTTPPGQEPRELAFHDAIELLVQSAHSAAGARPFLRESLAVIGTALGAPAGVLEVSLMSQAVSETWFASEAQGAFWDKTLHGVLSQALTEAGARARLYANRGNADASVAILSAPLSTASGRFSGSIVVVTSCPDREAAQELLAALTALVSLAARLLDSLRAGSRPGKSASDGGPIASLRKASEFSDPTELAFAITNRLRSREELDVVALGRVRGHSVRLLSISGLDEVPRKSPGAAHIRKAMEECLDLGLPVVDQERRGLSSDKIAENARLHAAWRADASGAAVATIPLKAGGGIVAVLACRKAPDASFSEQDVDELRELVEPYAGTLEFVEHASRSLAKHALDVTRGGARVLLGWGHLGAKLAVIGSLLALAWLGFGSMEYEVTVPCRLAVTDARHVGVPSDGVLAQVFVEPGDRVSAGDPLCSFDASAAELERAQLRAERAVLEIQRRRAMAADEPAEAELARANLVQVDAHLRLVEHRIDRALVRAPIDGVVVTGDLRERQGDVFAKGDSLFEIARVDRWALDLEVPESRVDDVESGASGEFFCFARPEERSRLRVDRVDPEAEERNGSNVYLAEASTEADRAWLRPGMEGLARIQLGERRPWWVLFHRVGDWARVHLWL